MADLATLVPELEPGIVTLSTVMVRALRIDAYIGVNRDEIGRRQPLVLDVVLTKRATMADRLQETIDYRAVVIAAMALAAERIGLIETFAQRLAGACLQFDHVLEVDVTIEKPDALPDAIAATRIVMARRGARAEEPPPHVRIAAPVSYLP